MRQQDLADRLKVNQRTVSYWESGANQPDFDTLLDIADIFDITLDELIAGI